MPTETFCNKKICNQYEYINAFSINVCHIHVGYISYFCHAKCLKHVYTLIRMLRTF